MSKVVKKVASVAAPVIGNMIAPGIGGIIGGAVGGGLSGGGLKGAALGALGAGLGGAASSGLGAGAGASTGIGASAGAATGIGSSAGSGFLSSVGSGFLSSVGSGLSGIASSILPGEFGGTASYGLGDIARAGLKAYSGVQGDQALRDAQRTQIRAGRDAMSRINPYAQTGSLANARIQGLLGLDPNRDPEEIKNIIRSTPGYQFQLEQGMEAMDRGAAARGGLQSGAALKAAQEYGQNLGDRYYSDYLANMQQQQGLGLDAASGQADIDLRGGNIRAGYGQQRSNLYNEALADVLEPRKYGLNSVARGY